jgi:hypothetical protein
MRSPLGLLASKVSFEPKDPCFNSQSAQKNKIEFVFSLKKSQNLTETIKISILKSKYWHNNHFQLRPPLSEFLDIFASFTRSVCQANVLNLFYMREKPWLIWDSNPGPLGIKSAMLPTEPLRSPHIYSQLSVIRKNVLAKKKFYIFLKK